MYNEDCRMEGVSITIVFVTVFHTHPQYLQKRCDPFVDSDVPM